MTNHRDLLGNSSDNCFGADTSVGTGKDETLDIAELERSLHQPGIEFLVPVDDVDSGQSGDVGDVKGLFDWMLDEGL